MTYIPITLDQDLIDAFFGTATPEEIDAALHEVGYDPQEVEDGTREYVKGCLQGVIS